MGLNIRLLNGDKCVINGAVISCRSQRTTLSVENFAQVIRAPDILDQESVKTPSQHVYFAIQLMLIDPLNSDRHRLHFNTVMAQIFTAYANPEVIALLRETLMLVDAADYYQALKRMKQVILYEKQLLDMCDASVPKKMATGL